MAQAQIRIPIFFQGVDADFTRLRHVRVENFGGEEACAEEGLVGNRNPAGHQDAEAHTPLGGTVGNSAPSASFILNRPPSYGVPSAVARTRTPSVCLTTLETRH